MGVSGGRYFLVGDADECEVDVLEEAVAEDEGEDAVLDECMAMRMRRALGEAEVMGEGGEKAAASDEEVGEVRVEAAGEPEETFSVSCFFGVTIAADGAASVDDVVEDEALSAFFLLTGVTATGLFLPANDRAAAEDEAVNVLTILPLLPLGVFSAARWRPLSFGCVEAGLVVEEVRSAARSRMSAGVLSEVSRAAG